MTNPKFLPLRKTLFAIEASDIRSSFCSNFRSVDTFSEASMWVMGDNVLLCNNRQFALSERVISGLIAP